jgi:DNA-binding beta-propeller fold protein YncE
MKTPAPTQVGPRTVQAEFGLLRVLLLAACCILTAGCFGDNEIAPPTIVPDIAAVERSATFSLTIDGASSALSESSHPTLEPSTAPIAIKAPSQLLSLQAFAKRIVHRPDIVWVDLYMENLGDAALRDTVVQVSGATTLWDFTRDPFTNPLPPNAELQLGGIGLDGVGHLVIGVPSGIVSELTVTIRAVTTKRAPTNSSTIAVTADGSEVWTTFADADIVAVIDTASDNNAATLKVPGHPVSVAITPDDEFVVVASAQSNEVRIIDRRTRKVVQTFGEDRVGREPRHVVVSPDGGRILVSSYVSDTVTALVRNDDTFRFERQVKVGRRPMGMAVTADSATLLVAHFLPRGVVTNNEAWISTLSTDLRTASREVAIDDHFNLDRVHCISDVFGTTPARLTTEGVATQLAGVFMPPTGAEAWIPGARVAGAAIIWERGSNPEGGLDSLVAIRPGELVPPFVFIFDSRDSQAIERQLAPGGVERPVAPEYMSCARFQNEIEWLHRDLIPSAPGQQVNRFLAFPAGPSGLTESGIARSIAFTKGGRRALVLSYGADEMLLVDALTHHPAAQKHFGLSGSNPNGLVMTRDGKKAYVSYANSPFVSVIDSSAYANARSLGPTHVPYEYRQVNDVPQVGVAFGSKLLVRYIESVPERPQLVELKQVGIADDPMDPILRRGAILFSSANPDKYPLLSQSRLGACASCHPDGGNDGSMWATMEGERRTMNLHGGVAGRGWLHSSATHADAREFVDSIVTDRFGGKLPTADLESLSRYLAFGIPTLQHPRVNEALAARGEEVFKTKCAGCHAGPQMTSGAPDPASVLGGGGPAPGLFDVGTAIDNAQVALPTFFANLLTEKEADLVRSIRGDRALGGDDSVQKILDFRPRPVRAKGAFKAPSLVNVWDNVLLFHDGRFTDLTDAVQYLSKQLNLALSDEDTRAVVEFLHTL